MPLKDNSVAVVGAGPAGLIAAEVLARGGTRVTVFERMPSPARKFLLAGRGGLNLTHAEERDRFVARYAGAVSRLAPALAHFGPQALRDWCHDLGEETFVGSSGRVFPASFKASPLLRRWLRRLDGLGVALAPRHRWTGWEADGALRFETPAGPRTVRAAATVLALGGASWPRLGSDGAWAGVLAEAGTPVLPFAPANCGFDVDWSDHFRARFEGTPLKGSVFVFGDRRVRGEAVVTRTGLEGGAIYALSAALRQAIAAGGGATLAIDLRPDLDQRTATARLTAARRGGASIGNALRKAWRLAPVAIGLLHEAAAAAGGSLAARSDAELATLVHSVPIRLAGVAPIGRAISSAGGVAWSGLDDDYGLVGRPGTFVAGEMLDWEAPTGGYLLTACFATGVAAAEGALRWLATH